MAATPQTSRPSPPLLTEAGVPEWVPRAHAAAAVGTAVIHLLDGILLWVNQAMLDLVQTPEDELLGRTVAELVQEGDRDRMTQALMALSDQPVSMARVQGPTPGSWLHVSLSRLDPGGWSPAPPSWPRLSTSAPPSRRRSPWR